MTETWTSALNLLIAAFTLAAIMLGAVKAADVLLGRRITSHNAKLQETIEAIRKESRQQIDCLIAMQNTTNARLVSLEDHRAENEKKLAYIQGQSDTVLKLMGMKDSIEKAAAKE